MRRLMVDGWVGRLACGMMLVAGMSGMGLGQSGTTANSTVDLNATTVRTVTGQVINAVTGQAVPRALVRMNAQAVLSDGEGKFEFSGVTASVVHLTAIKPGFDMNLDPVGGNNGRQIDLGTQDGAVSLRLYPDAVITGTVLAPNGDPLSQVQVNVLREVSTDIGAHLELSGQSYTNARGEFRTAVPSGDYAVEVPYGAHVPDETEAILPVRFPPSSSNVRSSVMHIAAGTEERVALRPEMQRSHTVHLRASSPDGQVFPLLEARLNNQLTFRVNAANARQGIFGQEGELKTELPDGSYTLIGRINRGEFQEYAETEVTIAEKDVDGGVLRFTRLPAISVVLSIDPASLSDGATSGETPPTVQQLGLSLIDVDETEAGMIGPTFASGRPSETPEFRVTPGRYRVHAQVGGQWFVKSVLSGSVDLLSHELEVAPGGSGGAIQVTASNQTGSVHGTLTLDGKAAECDVVLVATTPSASPMIVLHSGMDGSFRMTNVPPGVYIAIGFETRPSADLLDSAVREPYSTRMKAFDVTAGEVTEVALEAVPAAELRP